MELFVMLCAAVIDVVLDAAVVAEAIKDGAE